MVKQENHSTSVGYKEKTGEDAKNRERIIVRSGINRFGERLKKAMGGMSNSELGRRSGMSETTIRKYLQGKIYPGIDSAAFVADACDVSLIWLISGIEQKDESQARATIVNQNGTSLEELELVLKRLTKTQRETLTEAIFQVGINGVIEALGRIELIAEFSRLPDAEKERLMRLHEEIKKGSHEGTADTASDDLNINHQQAV